VGGCEAVMGVEMEKRDVSMGKIVSLVVQLLEQSE
jgi:hypothetical protein